jgi:hypothetical protein
MKISLLKTIVTLFIFSSILRADDNPCIMKWNIDIDYGFALQVTGGTPYTGQSLNPPIGTMMIPTTYVDGSWGYVIMDSLNMNIWAVNGTPLGSITANTKYVTNGDNGGQNYPYSSGTFNTGASTYLTGATLAFAYNASKSLNTGDAWTERWWYDLSISPASFNLGPAAIPNAGWSNGLGNSESIPVTGMNFWAIDYSMDFIPNTNDSNDYRWYASEGAIWQSTKNINGYGSGSRAYAVGLVQDSTTGDWSGVSGGTGVAYDGCWQIDIKVGSDGSLNSDLDDANNNPLGGTQTFCETFYLAERINLYPGTANYLDGSTKGGSQNYSQYGREIDIMETSWNGYGATTSTATGPQVNLPNGNPGNGNNTGWLETPVNGELGVNQRAAVWSDIGGAPTSDFATFGIVIRANQIWFYAYKPDGTQWYSYGPIDKTNTTYNQVGPFVPYIGTWNNTDPAESAPSGGFITGYKNFVYIANTDSMIKGFNPKTHPAKFGRALLRKAQTVVVKSLPYRGTQANRFRVGGIHLLSARASSGLNNVKFTTSDSSAAVIVKGRDGATLLRVLKKKPFKVIATHPGNSKWQSASGILNVSPN